MENLATLVPAQKTQVSVEEMIDAYAQGHEATMGQEPPPPCLSVEVAHACLECGNGQELWNFDFGNVKWSPGWDGLYCKRRCNEIIGGKVRWFDPVADADNPACWFRAFEDAAQGAKKQVEFLATTDRYREAWTNIYKGRADAAVRALGKAGYFTANVDAYAKAVVLISGHLLEPCARYLSGQHYGLGIDLVERLQYLVVESLYDPALRDLRPSGDPPAA